jgi:hypothetical protein
MVFKNSYLVLLLFSLILLSCSKEANITPVNEEDSNATTNNAFDTFYNTSNSGLLSNSINDIDYTPSLVKIATDNGYVTFNGTKLQFTL